jgi:hypothetical protein
MNAGGDVNSKNIVSTVRREAVAVFVEADRLIEAVDELQLTGLVPASAGIMATELAVREKLDRMYAQIKDFSDENQGPEHAFVNKASGDDTSHAVLGGLYFVGGTAAMGALVASAAVLASPLVLGITGAVAVGAIGTLVGGVIHKSDADTLREQLDSGHILLFVPLTDPDNEDRILEILNRHAALDVKIHAIPAT